MDEKQTPDRDRPEAVPPRIIVGVDGSEQSKEALRWAHQESMMRAAEVHAVFAWTIPTAFGYVWQVEDVDLEADARAALEQALDDTLGEAAAVVYRHVVPGHPVTALLALARPGDTLVVGSRGHGGFVGALLGSVSHYVVAHAPCPVVVVRHPREKAPVPNASLSTGTRT